MRIYAHLSYLHDMTCVFAVVEPALHVVAAFRSIDDDGEGVYTASDVAPEHMRQLVGDAAATFPGRTQLLDICRKMRLIAQKHANIEKCGENHKCTH